MIILKLRYTFILLTVFSLAGFINPVTAGKISINVTDEGTEVVGMGGVSNVNVNTGCLEGSGTRKSEQRELSSFNSIDIDGAFDVNITLQKKQRVTVSTDDNILPEIITKVKGNTLVITSRGSICPKSSLEVNISAPDIEKISSDGSNDIRVTGLNNANFHLDLDGASDVRASGETKKFVAELSGSGGIDAEELHAEDVDITLSGSGDAVVYSSGILRAEIDGAGDITYYGDPKKVSRKISGAGDIEKGD